jgi:hypothetical protein
VASTVKEETIILGYVKRTLLTDNNSFEVIVRKKDEYINVSKMVRRYTKKCLNDCQKNKQFKQQLSELKKICMFLFKNSLIEPYLHII